MRRLWVLARGNVRQEDAHTQQQTQELVPASSLGAPPTASVGLISREAPLQPLEEHMHVPAPEFPGAKISAVTLVIAATVHAVEEVKPDHAQEDTDSLLQGQQMGPADKKRRRKGKGIIHAAAVQERETQASVTSAVPIDTSGRGQALEDRWHQLYECIQKDRQADEGNYATWGRLVVLGVMPQVKGTQEFTQAVLLGALCSVLVIEEINGPPVGVMDNQMVYIFTLANEVFKKLKVPFDLDRVLEDYVTGAAIPM
jgi:hypothetical protein